MNFKSKKKNDAMKKTMNIATSLAAGAAIGTAAGMLLAPNTGKETRKNVAETAKRTIDTITSKSQNVMSKMEDPNTNPISTEQTL